MRIRHIIGWCFAVLFAGVGALFCFVLRGYRFTGYLCLGIALVLVLYRLLAMLATHRMHTAKLLRWILSTGIWLVLLAAVATGIYMDRPTDPNADCDYLVILGAGINGTEPSVILQERLDAAVTYLQKHPQTYCIVSGGLGAGEQITEAQCMSSYLIDRGIPREQILLEEQATSTAENLSYSVALIQSRTAEPVKLGILSSEFHLSRASLMARDLGIEVQMIPAKTRSAPLRINYFLREIPATWYYLVFGG